MDRQPSPREIAVMRRILFAALIAVLLGSVASGLIHGPSMWVAAPVIPCYGLLLWMLRPR